MGVKWRNWIKQKAGKVQKGFMRTNGHITKTWHFCNLLWSSKNTLKESNEDLDEIESTEVKAYSGSKKTSAEKKIELLTKGTTNDINSTLIESPGIQCSTFTTYVEEKLSGLNKHQRTITKSRTNVLFELKVYLLIKIFNLSGFSTAIFKILQSIKILTLWQMHLTVPLVVPQAQSIQWKTCQQEKVLSLTYIFLIAQSDVI